MEYSYDEEKGQLTQLLNSNPQEFVKKLSQSKRTTFNLNVNIGDNIPYVVEALLLNPFNRIHTVDLTRSSPIMSTDKTSIARLITDSKSLKTLKLGYNRIDIYTLINISNAMKDNTTLENLNLIGNNIGNTYIAHIANILLANKTLQSLNLSANNLNYVAIRVLNRALQSNTSLHTLILNYNNLGLDGAYHIAWLLSNNIVDNNTTNMLNYKKDYKSFSKNNTLKSLELNECNMGVAGAKYIANGLIFNSSLTSISLQDNKFEEAGSLLIFNALAANNSITHINMNNNRMQYINQDNIQYINDSAIGRIAHILQFKNPEDLPFVNNPQDFLKSQMFHNQRLVTSQDFLKSQMFHNQRLVTLTILQLSGTNIDDNGAALIANALKFNKDLTSVDLSYNSITTVGANNIFEALLLNPDNSLEVLYLNNNRIDDKIFSFIADDMSDLGRFIRNNLSTVNLNNINLSNILSNFSNEDIKRDSLYGKYTYPLKLTTLMLNNENINMLNNENINTLGALRIAIGLYDNSFLSSVKYLHIGNCNIRDYGLMYISEALKYNSTLETLYLNNNIIDQIAGLKRLAKTFKVNNTLTNILMYNNNLPAEGLVFIAQAIENNFNITNFLAAYSLTQTSQLRELSRVTINTIKEYIKRNKHNKYVKSLSLGSILYNNMTIDNIKYSPDYILDMYK